MVEFLLDMVSDWPSGCSHHSGSGLTTLARASLELGLEERRVLGTRSISMGA